MVGLVHQGHTHARVKKRYRVPIRNKGKVAKRRIAQHGADVSIDDLDSDAVQIGSRPSVADVDERVGTDAIREELRKPREDRRATGRSMISIVILKPGRDVCPEILTSHD